MLNCDMLKVEIKLYATDSVSDAEVAEAIRRALPEMRRASCVGMQGDIAHTTFPNGIERTNIIGSWMIPGGYME